MSDPDKIAAFRQWAASGGPERSEWVLTRREAAYLFTSTPDDSLSRLPVSRLHLWQRDERAEAARDRAELRVQEAERALRLYATALQNAQGIAINGTDSDEDTPRLRLDAIDALIYSTLPSSLGGGDGQQEGEVA